jgi:hypothetical protein
MLAQGPHGAAVSRQLAVFCCVLSQQNGVEAAPVAAVVAKAGHACVWRGAYHIHVCQMLSCSPFELAPVFTQQRLSKSTTQVLVGDSLHA